MKLRKELFWDIDFNSLDKEKHSSYIIERVLEFGNDKEAKWVYQNFPHSQIRKVVNNPRRLNPKTKALWKTLV